MFIKYKKIKIIYLKFNMLIVQIIFRLMQK